MEEYHRGDLFYLALPVIFNFMQGCVFEDFDGVESE